MKILSILLTMVATCATAGENVVVLLDTSGSMEQTMQSVNDYRINVARNSLINTLSALPPDTNLGILTFDGWICELGPINQNKLKESITSCTTGGGTPLGYYIKVAADALLEYRKKNHYGKYRLVIVTDGEANDSHLVDQYVPDIISRGIAINAIGVDMDQTHTLATKVHSYKNAADPTALEKAVLEVFAETKSNDNADFDFISGLPSDIAVQIIKTLAEPSNVPIGEAQAVQLDSSGKVQIDDQGNIIIKEGGWSAGSIVGLIFLIIAGGIVLLIVLAYVISQG